MTTLSRLLILTAFCSSAGAQPAQHWAVGPSLALLSTSTTPVNPDLVVRTNMFLWFSHLDLDTNNVNVNSWTDRIQGLVFTNMSGANLLNTSTGLYFTGSQWLSNTVHGFVLPNSSQALLVFSIKQAIGWLVQDGRYGWGADGLLVGDGDGGMHFEHTTHGTEFPGPLMTLNKFVDAGLNFSNNVLGTRAIYSTNGILTGIEGNVSYLGMLITNIGISGDLTGPFHGLLCEYMVWTNNSSYVYWNDTPWGMSNTLFYAHRYATNHYGTNILGANGIWP